MDLFATAGIEMPLIGGGRRGVTTPRSLRVPLFNHRVVEEARARFNFSPTDQQRRSALDYAKKARDAKFRAQKETTVRGVFIRQILIEILGYREFETDVPYTLRVEERAGPGAVDAALGRFSAEVGTAVVLAPFELKGPASDLDAVMPGRHKSPVQQAWEYAIDTPGARWVLVSNCVEIRLYGFGRGRGAYEVFDLTRIDEEDEHRRLWQILAAERLLGDDTDRLLRDSDAAARTITGDLYRNYKALRDRLVGYLVDSADGPRLATLTAIEASQKILDRILFVAFAQGTDLLPEKLLERALNARNLFVPSPLWKNFANLFRFVDRGNAEAGLNIPAYNGGLFAYDPTVDDLVLPDGLASDLALLGNWDYRREVSVTVLGHIFEQSITDLETMKAEAVGAAPPAVGKRKKEGVVYTPDMITRFLVEQTLGTILREREATLAATFGDVEPGEKEIAFWRAHLRSLRELTIVDPACGSGAFLVAAFDRLADEYRRVALRLEGVGAPVDFDIYDEIVTRNLYGVDLNAESVEITRLSLWLKTARRNHKLQNLELNIRVGNSLVDDPAFTDRPFDWAATFPSVFERGGFDVVLGNPPYVRMEHLKQIKPYLERHYVVADDRTDLYAYFFERAVKLLAPGGRLGFISSSTFFRTGSGEKLRVFLGEEARIEAIVDFGDLQIFEGVTTYPAIVVLRRGHAEEGDLAFLTLDDEMPDDLARAFVTGRRSMRRARLGRGSWRLEEEEVSRLRDKIGDGRPTLGEVYGAPMRGIVTGLNDAFVVDRATRDRLITADPKSAELLKPFLRGENIKRWRVESEDLWLIDTPKGKIDIDAYPAIRDHLLPFRPDLEKRATKQEWFELQQAQAAYQDRMERPKIVWPHFQPATRFAIDEAGFLLNNKCFFVSFGDTNLVGLLNSSLCWFQLAGMARVKRGGYLEAEAQYVDQIRIPSPEQLAGCGFGAPVERCTIASEGRLSSVNGFLHRLLDLPGSSRTEPSRRLEQFWTLDFAGFRAEIQKSFGADIPVKERNDWEEFHRETSAEVNRLTAEIAETERNIDAAVYALYDLTADEISLIERTVA